MEILKSLGKSFKTYLFTSLWFEIIYMYSVGDQILFYVERISFIELFDFVYNGPKLEERTHEIAFSPKEDGGKRGNDADRGEFNQV